MKKVAALLLVLIMVLSLCACAGQEPKDEPKPTDPTVAPTDPTVPSDPANPTDPTDPTDPVVPPVEKPWEEHFEVITIAQALELCGEEGNVTEDRYYIVGTILTIKNANYGQMTIQDEAGDTIDVYGTYSADGAINYSQLEEKPYKGDKVLLHCILQNYNGTKEVKNARLIDFEVIKQEIDESAYTESTIADARKGAVGAKVKVDGVVARITYANGMIPSGFYLIDETGSIYVYDGELAARVKEGNKITMLGTKDYWILADEQYNADKFGYKGCNQLTEAILVNNDNGTHEFDKSWIAETTVKAIMDTSVKQLNTTLIYKVTALVKKAPGNGFTNYYINDLDEKTGSYVYTQCNGNDFGWLDEFDGKICTVYVAVINAKSSASGCVYRFTPILVQDDKFDVSTVDKAKFAVEYVGLEQFMNSYSGNPALELQTSVSSAFLGFQNATLSYSSSNTAVISIDGNVMNCKKSGTATITVTGTYGGKSYSGTIKITVNIPEPPKEEYPTVADAIAAAVGETVKVKGIVGPSLVNKTGFYLIDESGVIAVQLDAATLATLKPGHEVVLEAVRHNNTNGGDTYYGQTCLKDAKVVVNNYGNHAYSDKTFITGKTLADFHALDVTKDYSTSVFVVKAHVVVEETPYFTRIFLSDGTNQITLYSSSAKQYSWLMAYADQEITVELAACNWNDKTFYAGCVLAVINADGSRTINTLNFQN